MNPFALITGGAKRVGSYICHHLAQQGFDLLIHYNKSGEAANSLQKELASKFPSQHFTTIQADLQKTQFSQISKILGERALDLLVHNASVFYPTPLEKLTEDQWENCFQVNTRAPIFLTQQLLPALRKSKNANIIFLGDIQGELSFPLKEHAAYGASKAAMLYLVRLLALELAPEIRVNAVSPGITIWSGKEPEAVKEKLTEAIPLKKINDPHNIAEAIYFLSQQMSITGTILPVDGGRSFARSDYRTL